MTSEPKQSEGARLKAHLQAVGEVKAASHREATAAHLALPIGERLERAVALSDAVLRLHRETAHLRPVKLVVDGIDEEAEVWRRVNEKLARMKNKRG